MALGQCGELDTPIIKEGVGLHQSAPTPCLARPANAASHSCGLAALRTTTRRASFSAAAAKSLAIGGRARIGRVDQKSDDRDVGHELTQQLEPLGDQQVEKTLTPVMLPPGRFRLATRPRATGSFTEGGDDRRGRGRRPRRLHDVIAAAGDHYSQRLASQLGSQTRHPVSLILRPAVFDPGVLAVDVTGLLEALEERREEGRITLRRLAVEKSDHRHRRLLRARRERPRPPRRRAA